jgi:hypothetical protein
MLVSHAKALARQWIVEAAEQSPGLYGAFSHGSANWLPDNASLDPGSDLDLILVVAPPLPESKPGKLRYNGLLLDVSYLSRDELLAAEQILGNYQLAGSFQAASILFDRSGHLATIQAAVAREYTSRRWVIQRCEHARDKVLANLQGLDAPAAFHEQVTAWLFAAGVATHILLVAGLKNPTVRRRYLAVRELLAEYRHQDLYPQLLDLLGCRRLSQERVAEHLAALAQVFDVAKTVIKTPFFFASDISDAARPIAIDGSRALIQRGDHREALFWIVATYSRCQQVLAHDAPRAVQQHFDPGYRRLLADLGISDPADLRQRGDAIKRFLPQLWETAMAIVAANPGIHDAPAPS